MKPGSTSEAQTILETLGVRADSISDRERNALDERGYVVLEGILTAVQIEAMLAALELLTEEARADPTFHAGGTKHLEKNLIDTGQTFDPAWTAPQLLAAIQHILGPDFRIGTVGYRAPKPEHGAQALHADYPAAGKPGEYQVATAILALADFTKDNGPTRVVPGSHRLPAIAAPKDLDAPFPGEERITCAAGSALVFNGHLWHSGTRNRSGAPREALQITFMRRGARGMYIEPKVSNATFDRLGTAGMLLL